MKRLNLTLFLLWPIVAMVLSFKLGIGAFLSPIIFYGTPAGLLSIFKPSRIKKTLILSLFSVPFVIIVDYIAELTKTWLWPLPNSIFPFRLFSLVSIEVILWAYLNVYVVILFYEYFFEKNIFEKIWHDRSKKFLIFTTAAFLSFVVVLIFFPKILRIPYFYFVFGTVGILLPVIIQSLKFPKILAKLVKTALYFFYLNLIYELTALKMGWWSFPGQQFVGQVSFLGVTFPFEEFFFWITLFTLTILSYYEYFFDDEK